jgi:DNA-binding response OmpR family regulator
MRTPDGLTGREREFLSIVISASPRIATHDAIARLMYGDAKNDKTRSRNYTNIRMIASRLRRKRPECGVVTVDGEGYVANVKRCPECKGDGWVKR